MKAWGDAALAALERSGRRSAARRAVVELLDRQACCVSAQEIHEHLRGGARVGLASVYRTLDQLSRDGLLQKIELGDGTTRYEPAYEDGEHQHHHHLVCDGCGRVEAFADDRLERALRRVEARTGFAVAAHDVVLRGACEDCAD